MDKIWDRKSEVIGRCGGDEKTNDHAEQTKEAEIAEVKRVSGLFTMFKY